MGEMHEGLTLLLREVCEFTGERRRQALQQSRQKGLSELIEEVKAFIEGHYRDPNLNVTMIGQQFDRKPTYLSKLFKDGTGRASSITSTRSGWSRRRC
ncbi:hypothetical protein N6H14_07625 [Paenibacillus sp. CC-CFT747]|nr:hypothetical protein N6H14_07625 [Paenibacillus sp. CC-CFT747]